MTNLQLPARMLAWKASTNVVRMEEVPIGDPRRTVQGFVPDNKFNAPAPKLVFDDPYEEEEDRLNKVTKYWKVCDQERLMRESRYRELRGAEEAAASRKRSEDAAKKLKEAQEKEEEKEKGKEKEAGPSGSAKGKAKEVLKTPKKTTPKKSKCDVRLESKEEEEPEGSEERPACIYCVQKKIKCEPLDGRKVCAACHKRKVKCEFFDKTAWTVMDGSEKIAEAVRDLTKLERRRTAGLLEKSWYDLDICALNLEQMVDRDLMEADGKVLTLLDMKSRGVEILADVEKRVMANRSSIVASYTCQGTPPDFRLEPFRSESSLASSTVGKRFHAGFTLSTFVDCCGRRVGGLVGDSGRLVEGICACSHSI
ncbi:hypothetical protein M422DRAFT_265232 [Sphaerobolus stellatus SS14]|uniref:Zn(2)-C6 fungal-type domain-containing protein n=1 Tax=Sphaerobolus stellatus (strain SS14) TaxID=990650 RepID=A0A0C9UDW4_SPHS4|nr:hypothetical protein M422DRAFT_265232 [Sphaerobolus stellatus SS14]